MKASSTLLIATTLLSISTARSQNEPDDAFECGVKELDIFTPWDETERASEYICATEDAKIYTLSIIQEKEKKNLQSTVEDWASKGVVLRVPHEAVSSHTFEIQANHPNITVSYTEAEDSTNRRRLTRFHKRLNSTTGTHKFLVVRINGAQSIDRAELVRETFGSDNRNYKTIMADCSAGQLNIVPATGSAVTDGVIDIKVNEDVRNHWNDMGNAANEDLNQLEQAGELDEYTTRVFVLEDTVDMEDSAGLAYLRGNTMWIKAKHAFKPQVQVHEYGHMLGMAHSGKLMHTEINGWKMDAYGDSVGYMGNKLPWDKEGAAACFNGPKLWYSGWYSQGTYQSEMVLSHTPTTYNLMDIDTAAKLKRQGVENPEHPLLIKFGPFFISYNRAFGINAGTKYVDANRIIVTQQDRLETRGRQESKQLESLGLNDEAISFEGSFKIRACTIEGELASFAIVGIDPGVIKTNSTGPALDCESITELPTGTLAPAGKNTGGSKLWYASPRLYKLRQKHVILSNSPQRFDMVGLNTIKSNKEVSKEKKLVIMVNKFFFMLHQDRLVITYQKKATDPLIEITTLRSGEEWKQRTNDETKNPFRVKACNIQGDLGTFVVVRGRQKPPLSCESTTGTSTYIDGDGAKLWYTSPRPHKNNTMRVNPTDSVQRLDMMGLSTMKKNNQVPKEKKLVIRVNKVFLMLHQDRLVITHRGSTNANSSLIATLGSGEEWKRQAKNEGQNRFTVKACDVQGDQGYVLIQRGNDVTLSC